MIAPERAGRQRDEASGYAVRDLSGQPIIRDLDGAALGPRMTDGTRLGRTQEPDRGVHMARYHGHAHRRMLSTVAEGVGHIGQGRLLAFEMERKSLSPTAKLLLAGSTEDEYEWAFVIGTHVRRVRRLLDDHMRVRPRQAE